MRLFRRTIDNVGMFVEPVDTGGKALGKRIYVGEDPNHFYAVNGFVKDKNNNNYGLYEDKQQRMAGEDLSQALTDDDVLDFLLEIEEPSSPTKALPDAYNNLMNQTNEYARLNKDLVNAGVRESDIDLIKELDTGTLKGGVPGPYRKSRKGIETRVFMDRKANAITGKDELVPYLDPGTQEPLSIRLGKVGLDGIKDRGSERIQLAALKLMGKPSRLNNTVVGKEHRADFVQQLDEQTHKQVEGMVRSIEGRYRNTVGIPSYTAIVPNTSFQGPMNRTVRDMVNKQIVEGKSDGITAVEALLNAKRIGIPDASRRIGKLNRSDSSLLDKDEIYDQMIITGYPQAKLNDDTAAYAPDTVHLAPDLAKVKQAVMDMNANEARKTLQVTNNYGHDGQGGARTQIKHVLDMNRVRNGTPLFVDAANAFPNVQQLLSNLEYVKKPRN